MIFYLLWLFSNLADHVLITVSLHFVNRGAGVFFTQKCHRKIE